MYICKVIINLKCLVMKNLIVLLVACFFVNIAIAQTGKKNAYKVKGDVIEAVLYHDNGMVAQTGFYTLENKLEGEWISYDTNGNKSAVAHYNNGKKVGTWKFYQGTTQKEVVYNDSKIAKVNTWEVTDTRIVSNNP